MPRLSAPALGGLGSGSVHSGAVDAGIGEAGDVSDHIGAYTAYGNNDTAEFTGVDAPEAQEPGAEPYKVYRFNAKRWDQASGSYDMGSATTTPG